MQAIAPAGMYTGLLQCLRDTCRAEGVGALFKGIAPAVLGIMPVSGIEFSVYYILREVCDSY